jgi:hypothetical protein
MNPNILLIVSIISILISLSCGYVKKSLHNKLVSPKLRQTYRHSHQSEQHPASNVDNSRLTVIQVSRSLAKLTALLPVFCSPITSCADGALAEEEVSSLESTIASTSTIPELKSDELVIIFTNASLGLTLTELNQRGFPLVIVKSIRDEELLKNSALRVGDTVEKVGSVATAGYNLEKISDLIKSSPRPIDIMFRDPTRQVCLYTGTVRSKLAAGHFMYLDFSNC